LGVEYRGVMIVGYTHDQMEDIVEAIDPDASLMDFVEEADLDYSGPYYDACRTDCIFGKIVAKSGTYSTREVDARALDLGIQNAVADLTSEWGVEPKLYIMAEGF
jgi:hypothetical protein